MKISTINCRSTFPARFIHSHDVWEIILTSSGYGTLVIEDIEYEFQPSRIICVPPNQIHYNNIKGNLTHIYMRVDDFIAPTTLDVPIVLMDDEEKSCESLMFFALRMFYKEDSNYDSILNSLSETIFQLLLSLINTSGRINEIELFKNYLISNLTNPEFHASDAFEKVPYSIDHFRKRFKKNTGMTPTSYLLHIRIEYAKKLLTLQSNSNVKISDIALRSGFYDPLYFSRVFRSVVGLNPQNYLMQLKEKNSMD